MTWPEPFPDLAADERTTLTQFLDHWRERMVVKLEDLTLAEASARALPATTLTVAGIVRHLAYVEDRWFHFRLAGHAMPEPWGDVGTSKGEDWTFELDPGDTVATIVDVYRRSCERSRAVERSLASLDARAPTPSFGKEPITLRWALIHMIEETACHAGHVDLLRDAILRERS